MSKFEGWNTDDFIEYIEKLETEIKNKAEDQRINFKWAGNLGQWSWFYQENRVIFNNLKVESLGYKAESLGDVNFQFFTSKLHPSDYDHVMNNMAEHLNGAREAYEVEYRIRHMDGHYLWYYDRGVITKRDQFGKPLVLEGIVFDISESKRIEKKLRVYAEKDTLTKAMNRRMFFKDIAKCIENYENNQVGFSLIMIDIDHFKTINDTYGHLVGDQTLKVFAAEINKLKRKNHVLYRYGGDEFFMILPKAKLEVAVKLGKNIQDKISNLMIQSIPKISLSMGIVEYNPHESIDELIKRVDELMYEAKRKGRNQFIY